MITIVRLLLRLLFRFTAFNEDVLKTPGPVLLLPNHVSWFDWLFIGVCLERDWRIVTSSTAAQRSFLHRWIMVNRRTYPIDPLSPYGTKHMAEYLQSGGRLVLFPEGRISTTGSLMKLFDGTGFLLHRSNARIVTAYLRGAHRLPFSYSRDQKRLFPRVTVHFSALQVPPKPRPLLRGGRPQPAHRLADRPHVGTAAGDRNGLRPLHGPRGHRRHRPGAARSPGARGHDAEAHLPPACCRPPLCWPVNGGDSCRSRTRASASSCPMSQRRR